ncbi:MAG: 4Fe-4S binding protein [Zestosphaera sp.]
MSEGSMFPLSRPTVGVSGRTGTWRIQRPVYNAGKCIKCRLCWLYCPDSVIDLSEGGDFILIDYDYCKGCGVCASVCPTKAIEMRPEG